MSIEDFKRSLSGAWEAVANGWRRFMDSAESAMTPFKAEEKTGLPASRQLDDAAFFPTSTWAMLAGNVFEDEGKIVVSLEIPGMEKSSLSIEASGRQLVVSGEKRFERERNEGRYRSFQCAYGSFHRTVQLPADVISDRALATYRDGVLRIELPKRLDAKPKSIEVKVS